MKRIILSLLTLAAGLTTSCNIDAEFSEFVPTHPLSTLVKSATATCGSETVSGTVDNSTHEIKFVFIESSNFSDVKVTLDYATRAILKEGAPEAGQQINLSSTYSFVLNNLEEDFTYTIAASRALVTQVDHSQCSVIELDNDAIYLKQGIAETKSDPYFCFDGKHMSKKNAYSEITYNSFGWQMYNPQKPEEVGHGNSFTFDAGEPMRLSKVIFWPYWPYNNQAPAIYELYAYRLPGEPAQSGEWTNWEKIADIDDSQKWQPTKDAEPGSPEDLTVTGTVLEFKYDQIPEARYYRVKMLKNFYAAFGTAMNQYWSGRINYCQIAEVELWRYNNEE